MATKKILKFKILRIGGDNQAKQEEELMQSLRDGWEFVGSYTDSHLGNVILKYERYELS